MGYSENPELLESRMALFSELRQGIACQWRCEPSRAATKRLMDQLHEGLHIAKVHKDRFPELARAKESFRLQIVKPGLIEAKPKPSAGVVVTTTESFGPVVSTVGCRTAQDIIDAWREHMPSLDLINFQQHRLDALELEALYNWCERNEPRLMMMVGEGFITISLRVAFSGGVDYSWKPPVAPPPQEKEYDIG